MAQSRQRRETPSLESARDSKQQVLLFPTWFTSWLCTLSQESAVHHLHFPKILLPPTCLLRNNSCLAEPPGAMLQNRGTYRSQTSSPPPPPLLFLSTARPVFPSSRPPKLFLKLLIPPRSHTKNLPSHAPRVSGRLRPPAHTSHGLCPVSQGLLTQGHPTQQTFIITPRIQGACSSPPPAPPGHNNPTHDPCPEAPVGVTQSTGSH